MGQMDVDQVTLDGDSEKSLGGLSGYMESGGDLLLRLTGNVIEPSDSSGLVEFIGFSGGHRIDIDICPAAGQMLDQCRVVFSPALKLAVSTYPP
jgi:hypothetical protein